MILVWVVQLKQPKETDGWMDRQMTDIDRRK